MASPRDDSEDDELDDELEDDSDILQKPWPHEFTPSRSASNSVAQCSLKTTKFCAQHKIPTPPLSFRIDGRRRKFNAEERSRVRFIISHIRQEFLESIEIIFDRDRATLRKIVENKYDKCKDHFVDDQQWFKNHHFLQLFSPILDRTKIAGSQALLDVAQRSMGRSLPASVSRPSASSLRPQSKRARDEGENERNTNGSQSPETATRTNTVASSQSTGFGSSQTQTRSERVKKRVRITTGDNVEGKGNEVVARLQRGRGKMREVYPEETNEKRGKDLSSRLTSTSALVSIPPSPPSVPFAWNLTPTPPSSLSHHPFSSQLERSIATPSSAASTSTLMGHDDTWDEEWWRAFLRRHHFESDLLVNSLRDAEIHQIHIEHMLHNNDYVYQNIETWLSRSFNSLPLTNSYILTLAEIIWKEKLELNSK